MDKNELLKDIVEWAWDNSFVEEMGDAVVEVPELANHIDTLLPQETDAEIAKRMTEKFAEGLPLDYEVGFFLVAYYEWLKEQK